MATIHAPRPPTNSPPRGSGISHIAPNDLPRLIKWLYAIDREFPGDALWLRYDKLKRQAHHTLQTLQESTGDEHPFPFRRRTLPPAHSEPSPHVVVPSEASKRDFKDHLTSLPHDIRLIILEFLLKPLPVPEETKEVEQHDSEGRKWSRMYDYVPPRRRPPHPLNQIASTPKAWRDLLDAFCGHELLILKQQIALGRQDDWVPWRELRTYTSCARMELVVRLSECCAFCGIATVTQSKRWPGLTCCGPCEDPWHLPEVVRKRVAKKAKRKAMADHVRASPYMSRPWSADRA
ncbi:hypothetical protein Q7P35_002129 [Cladosporium inversicolor]